jgi:hypothetical protein
VIVELTVAIREEMYVMNSNISAKMANAIIQVKNIKVIRAPVIMTLHQLLRKNVWTLAETAFVNLLKQNGGVQRIAKQPQFVARRESKYILVILLVAQDYIELGMILLIPPATVMGLMMEADIALIAGMVFADLAKINVIVRRTVRKKLIVLAREEFTKSGRVQ